MYTYFVIIIKKISVLYSSKIIKKIKTFATNCHRDSGILKKILGTFSAHKVSKIMLSQDTFAKQSE